SGPSQPLSSVCVALRNSSGGAHLAGTARQTGHVQDQGYRAIAEYRCTGNTLYVTVVGIQGLDDHLLLTEQLVDQQRGAPALALHDQQQTVLRAGVLVAGAKLLPQ